jgi:beta-galactosidase
MATSGYYIPWFLCFMHCCTSLFASAPERFAPPPSERMKINIDKNWLFINRDFPAEEETHQVNQLPWQTVDLPHDWTITGAYDKEHNTTQGFMPMNIGWYRKGLRFPETYAGKKIYLIFDGVFRASDVWMNYAHLGHHESGYTSFAYDITDHVRTGNRIPNGLRVRVDGRRHEQDMYEGNGIYRHVWLVVTNPLHIANWGTFVTTPSVSKAKAMIKIETTVKNETAVTKDCRLITHIVDAEGYVVASTDSRHAILPGSEHQFAQTTDLSNPHLWGLETPYLYRACSVVMDGAAVVDTTETPFGVRSYRFDPNRGFFLNGNHVKLRGFNAHYDFAGLGTALPDRIHWNAMMAMKQAGFNFYRSSHNPATPERLDVCDRIGMLVWDEIERKLENVETELRLVRDTIIRDRNHPSVILWSLENESPLESTLLGTRIIKAGTELAHELDPSRLTTFAASMPVNAHGYGEAVDVVSYNYHWRRADQDHADFPHWRIGLLSEYSAARSGRGNYGVKCFERADDDSNFDFYSGEMKTMYEMCTTVEDSWQRIKARQYLAGGCLWCGIDSWGEGGAWPLVSRGDGALDLCHFPKDVYYYFVSQWTDRPMVHLFPHWNWSGKEGEPIDVWCYTNCDQVELFLNNKSLGTRHRPKASDRSAPNDTEHSISDTYPEHLSWKVQYYPGSLRAVGTRNGKVACSRTIHTAGEPARIQLTRLIGQFMKEGQITPLVADGRDAIVIKAAILDAEGHIVPTASSAVTFKLDGGATMIGIGNGNIISHESNHGACRKAHNGLCAVVVRSTEKVGAIAVMATAPGLEPGRMTVNAVSPEPVGILVGAEAVRLHRQGSTMVSAEICDKYGAPVPAAVNRVTFQLAGPALFENGQRSIVIPVVGGKALATIAAQKESSRVTVTAHSGRLVPGKVDLEVE